MEVVNNRNSTEERPGRLLTTGAAVKRAREVVNNRSSSSEWPREVIDNRSSGAGWLREVVTNRNSSAEGPVRLLTTGTAVKRAQGDC